jgi:hypothetical protein
VVSNKNMLRVRLLLILTLFFAVLLTGRPAHACTCMGSGAPCQAFFDVSAVFAGTVQSITDRTGPSVFFRERRVRLVVAEAFRGVASQEVDVDTGNGGGDCGYSFKVGESYLVYAQLAKDGQTLTTSICTRTRPARDAQDDLAFARAVAGAPAAGGVISGAVRNRDRRLANPPRGEHPFAPVAGVAILVECDGVIRRAETDVRGRFEIAGLPAGICSPRVTAPDATYVAYQPSDVTIRDLRACVGMDVTLAFDGRIRGRVLDASLRPLAGVTIDAIVPGERAPSYSHAAVTDASGLYEIAKVSPGPYVVGINARQDSGGLGFGRAIYFPAAATADTAETVLVGAGEQVALGDFTLASNVAFVHASGIVVTESGQPAAGAKIHLLRDDPKQFRIFSGPMVADEQGRFILAIPRGEHVKLIIEWPRPVPGLSFHWDRGDVPAFVADKDLPNLQIVVRPVKR